MYWHLIRNKFKMNNLHHHLRLFGRQAVALVAIATVVYIGVICLSHPSFNDSALVVGRRGLYETTLTMPHTQVFPSYTDRLVDVWYPMEVTDQPFFWYIPKAGGLTFQKICAQCLNLVSASAKGNDTYNPNVLTIYQLSTDHGLYLNVKPDTKEGIDHAKQLDLVSSGMADIYISQLLAYSTTALFDSSHTARMIAMFRHPTKRIIDLFYYQQRATWEPNYDITMATMTLEEFAASEKMIDNFMVRSLLDILSTSEITMQHVAVAKEILRRKFVIGITEWYEQSIVRFEKYFGWWDARGVVTNQTVNDCHYELIHDGDTIGQHPFWDNADKAYQMITVRNWADVELYVYAKHLFALQEELVHGNDPGLENDRR